MSIISEKINERLSKPQLPVKRQISLLITDEYVNRLDLIAKVLSSSSGKTTTRNMLIEDAIEAFTLEAEKTFKEKGIDIEDFYDDDNKEFFDTVVYPAHNNGFIKAFLNENLWYHVRINKDRIPLIKYVAIYRGTPESRITHYAQVAQDGYVYDDTYKGYVVHFEGYPIELDNPIPLGSASSASVRAPRYTTLQKLLAASEYSDL